ncbi:SusD/RagB family nutrient-binding outer membrane lipoprotein [Flagellimonas nanhaiensis]|uniref:SusD/RagB family nutrient-binding outer membrane lipoprotein n=1 Tax=Flagellimonas nanhaiensis TaxID=2292706 RepID=A0A371JLT5_9FLAO|nr:SusD/RagB family nutrient-binding outer membrane lipoprotein [Allomuricauda nanhaiensis]RDY58024.1 SusD/RagB family nutrient-binding outer membrane lipoprotein [Allomuricauda nanhaiensis]
MKSRYKIILSLIFLVSATACDEYLDVNDNPNQLVEVPSGDLLLGGTLLANAQVQQGQLARTSMYYTGGLIGLQLVQQTLYNYDYTPGDSNAVWGHLYNGILVQNKEIRRLSPDVGLLQGIIDVNEALAVGTAASLFGDIPYSTATPDNPGVDSEDPTLDGQADVYAALQTLLDNAIPKLQNGSTTSVTDSQDYYFGGDADSWIAAAYTLKARYYLQTKQYAQALANVVNGINSASGTMYYNPIGDVPGNSNILFNFVNSSRAGDMTGEGTFYRDLMDPDNAGSRNNAKTDETARRNYSFISGDGNQSGGIDDATTPMKLVSYEENILIWAECLLRANNDVQGAIDKLNELRAYLNTGAAFNLINGDETFLYDAYVLADFEAGGMENADNIATDRAVMREIIEERYVTGFSTYMPFNDARRLRAETDVLVPFPLNNATTTVNPQRFLYAQDEINNNSNLPDPIPDLFTPTPVNQ